MAAISRSRSRLFGSMVPATWVLSPSFLHPLHSQGFPSKSATEASSWPCRVESQLAMWTAEGDAGLRKPPGSASPSFQGGSSRMTPPASPLFQGGSCRMTPHEGDLEVASCRRLCEDGPLTEAVHALNLLVQQGRRISNNLFYIVLNRCFTNKDLLLGRRIHALSVECGYEGDGFLATHLIGMYAVHGRLEEAMRVFSKVSTPSAYMWASIMKACVRHGEPAEAVRLYRQMLESTIKPDNRIFVAVLKACARAGDLAAGKDIHAHVLASSGKPDIFVQNSLVGMYAKCNSLEDARRVFDRLPRRDVVTWTAMIAGYAQQGLGQEALDLYTAMQKEGITPPNSVTFVCLLQACASVGAAGLQHGKQLHAQIQERKLQGDVIVGNSLVNMYAKCGSVEDARRVFDRLCQKDVVTWNAMIAGYAQQGMGQEALDLYSCLQKDGITHPSSVTFVSLLQACASVSALPLGKQLHAQIEEQGLQANVVVGASLVNMYAKCGSLEEAQRAFDRLLHKNVVTWNAMIAGYAQQGMSKEAFSFYKGMQREGISHPNSVTFICLLQACASSAALALGKQLHAQIVERGLQADIIVGNSLVNMYARCGSLQNAHEAFDGMSHKTVVTWNAMIAGCVQQGQCQEALRCYNRMQLEGISQANSITFVCLLQACASVAALPLGKQLHAQIEEQGLHADVFVGSCLVNMYAKCGNLEDAQQVFDSLPETNIVAWGALVTGYARQGNCEVVFALVDRMMQEGIKPDSIMFLSMLTVCSHVGLVDKGQKYFESMSTDYGITPTIEHYNCMTDLLGRAGHLDEALQMVKAMPFQPSSAVWLTLLGACQKWNDVEVGRQAFEFAVNLDGQEAAAYVLMSNIYVGAKMWEEAKEMQARRLKCGAWKEPGRSWWTDMGGIVHSFVVGDRTHPIMKEYIKAGMAGV